HVTHQYAPAIGGSERYITDLSETLARRGHTVDVFTSQSRDYHTWRNELPAREQINGVTVHRFPSWARTQFTWRILNWGLSHYARTRARIAEPGILVGNGPISPPLFRALTSRAGDYDLVHINQLHYAHAWTAYRALRHRGLPIVLTPHLHAEQWQTYDIGYLWQVLRGSDALLAVTRVEQEFLQRRLPGQIVVQGGNGLNLNEFPARDPARSRARFGLPPEAFVLLFLGRKTEYKGLEPLLQAFTLLRPRHPELYLLAVGPETAYSEQLWSSYGQSNGLVVRGALSNEERLDALAACDLLAMPSTGEAFGIVYLEAWAYSKPVIGANIRAVASLISNEVDGFVVDPEQPSALLNAILSLITDRSRARRMGWRGQAKVRQRYTTDHIADVVEGLYGRVVRHARTCRLGHT
ncbi:MAG TPA: glycosyltransferase family 4 protein, partial [Caldilineaceae bacterium]|nr:glycosyltransferase family 4 protein [Caldilineaceae bacterium]